MIKTLHIPLILLPLFSCMEKKDSLNKRETWNDKEYHVNNSTPIVTDTFNMLIDSSEVLLDTVNIVIDSFEKPSLTNIDTVIITPKDSLKDYSLSKICHLINNDSLDIEQFHPSFSLILDSLCYSDTSSIYHHTYLKMLSKKGVWADTIGKKTVDFIECDRRNFKSFIESFNKSQIDYISILVGNRLYKIEQDKINYSTSKQWFDEFYIELSTESSEKLLLFCDKTQKAVIKKTKMPNHK